MSDWVKEIDEYIENERINQLEITNTLKSLADEFKKNASKTLVVESSIIDSKPKTWRFRVKDDEVIISEDMIKKERLTYTQDDIGNIVSNEDSVSLREALIKIIKNSLIK